MLDKTDDLERVLDNTPFLLTRCTADLRYRYVSKAYAAVLGRPAAEIAGKPIVEIIGPDVFQAISPYIEAVLRGQRVEYEAEVDYPGPGSRRYHVIYVPDRDEQNQVIGWITSIVDITERKFAEDKSGESEDRFRNMADHAPVLLWMAGRDKLCNFFNQSWLEFTGRTLEQEIGNGWAEGVHPDDMQRCLDIYYAAFDARQPFRMEYRLRRHDGEYRWVSDMGTPRFAPNGAFMGYVGSAIDISDQKQAEESNRRLGHLQRLAVAGELTAAIAHELKQPLSSIIFNLDAAERLLHSADPQLSELRDIIFDIRDADRRATEILGRIRDFTLKRDVQKQALDLNSTVGDTLQLIASQTQRRRVQVHAELAAGLPLISGDRTQLQQVLINVLINGMDAMASAPESERSLTVQTQLSDDDHVEVAVTDHGSGIAPDVLPHIFESFFTTKGKGMGLGLALSRSIVDSHHGRIWADNNVGGGTTFRFTLPVPRPSPGASRTRETA
jgi:PAS domain S-box-containing protein